MKKFWIIVLFCIFSCCAWAQEEIQHDISEQTESFSKPSCTDNSFYKKALEKIQSYLVYKPTDSAKIKRTKILRLKAIKGFEEVPSADFDPKTDFNAANAIVMLKINQKVAPEDILLCKQSGTHKKPIYIVAHPYFDNIKAYIINLDLNSSNYEDISFIYP